MTTDDLIGNIIKNGMFTLIGSKITRAIGEKDISDIIAGTGWAIIAVNVLEIVTPMIKTINDIMFTLNKWGDIIEKIFQNNSILNKIINFGAK